MANYNGLAAFLLVDKERSFNRAAIKRGVSHPVLSSITTREEKFGPRLGTRSNRLGPVQLLISVYDDVARKW